MIFDTQNAAERYTILKDIGHSSLCTFATSSALKITLTHPLAAIHNSQPIAQILLRTKNEGI